MPYAATHVILTVILVDLFRDYFSKHKKLFSINTIFIAGIAGLLPDIDVFFEIFFNLIGVSGVVFEHGGFTHTILFGLFFLIPSIILWKIKKKKLAILFSVITFGVFLHLFLDYLIYGAHPDGLMLFWPLSIERFQLHLIPWYGDFYKFFAAIDAIVLLFWLWHEEKKHKIKDFF